MPARRPFAERLGLPDTRGHAALVAALVVASLGAGAAGPLMLLYLTLVAGLDLPTAGALLTGGGLVSLVVPALVGRLSAALGSRTVVVAGQLLQAVGTAGLLLAALPVGRGLPLLVLWTVAIACGQRAFWSAVFALIADTADRTSSTAGPWFALAGMTQGTGFATGAIAAGALLTVSGPTPYVAALGVNVCALLASAVLLMIDRDGSDRVRSGPTREDAPTDPVHRDRPYLLLIGANTLFAVCSVMLTLGLPLYVVTALDAPAWVVGPLLALNTVLGATCQGVAVRVTARFSRVRVLVGAGIGWTVWGLASAALPAVPSAALIPALVLSVLVYSLAELVHAPVSMELAARSAPRASRDDHLAWFQYSFAVASTVSPGLFALSFAVAPALPWLVTAIVAALACVAVVIAGRALSDRMS